MYRSNELDLKLTKVHELPLAYNAISLAAILGMKHNALWAMMYVKQGGYYRTFRMRKKGGGYRIIDAPESEYKLMQLALLRSLFDKIKYPEYVAAFVPGRSCAAAASKHVGKRVVVKLDLKDFFPSIRIGMVRSALKDLGYNDLVSGLIAKMVTLNGRLPQGAPTSGAAANMVAHHRFDKKLVAYAKPLGWEYTRYADDLIFSSNQCTDVQQAVELINQVRKVVSRAGFRVNNAKTKIRPYYKQQRVLGITVNKKLNIPQRDYKRVRALVHNCVVHGPTSQLEKAGAFDIEELYNYLQGKLANYAQYAPGKTAALRAEMERITWENVTR